MQATRASRCWMRAVSLIGPITVSQSDSAYWARSADCRALTVVADGALVMAEMSVAAVSPQALTTE